MTEPMDPATVAVVILTRNEEANLAQALESISGWADQICVLDSLSVDGTVTIAKRYGCQVAQKEFTNFALQRNYALQCFAIQCEWVLFLDADEWLPEALKQEISGLINRCPEENGFYLNRRLLWMGCWIRRGYYPSWILRLFRYGKGRCEDRTVNEHLIVEGATGYVHSNFMHEDRKGLTEWTNKHNQYASMEATELMRVRASGLGEMDGRRFGTQAQRKRWLRHTLWNRLPPLLRPLFYFFYRYVLAGGFLDGREAFAYHFLQALWYPMLIDAKYLELVAKRETQVRPGEPR